MQRAVAGNRLTLNTDVTGKGRDNIYGIMEVDGELVLSVEDLKRLADSVDYNSKVQGYFAHVRIGYWDGKIHIYQAHDNFERKVITYSPE